MSVIANRPRLHMWADIQGFDSTDKAVRDFKDEVNREGATAFRASHGKVTGEAATALEEFCNSRGIPVTLLNLEVGLRELVAKGDIDPDTMYVSAEVSSDVPAEKLGAFHRVEIETRPVEGRLLEPTREDREKWADTGTDYARKQRDKKLKQAAHAERWLRKDPAGVTHV